jgi:hypothetical protein
VTGVAVGVTGLLTYAFIMVKCDSMCFVMLWHAIAFFRLDRWLTEVVSSYMAYMVSSESVAFSHAVASCMGYF